MPKPLNQRVLNPTSPSWVNALLVLFIIVLAAVLLLLMALGLLTLLAGVVTLAKYVW